MEYKGFTYTPTPKTAWDNLSMLEKSEMMKVAVRNGITDLKTIREKYNEFAEGGDTNPYAVGATVDALYASNPREEFLGEPSHHYDFTQSEEWANEHGYYPDARGHRDDSVKKPAHPSHPSRGTWNGDKFELTDLGMKNPNYTLFGLNDGGQDPQAVLTYQGGIVLPEVTVTPNENYFYNPYDNIILHQKANGGKIHIKPSKKGTFTAAATKHGMGVQEFASKVLANKDDYSLAMVKKANFARNARHWKHGLGGNLFSGKENHNQQMQLGPRYWADQTIYHDWQNSTIDGGTLPEVIVSPTNDASWLFSTGRYVHNPRKPLADKHTRKVVSGYLSKFDDESAKDYNERISRLADVLDIRGVQFKKNDVKSGKLKGRAHYIDNSATAYIDNMEDILAEVAHPWQYAKGNNNIEEEVGVGTYDSDNDPRGGTRYAYPDTAEGETHGFFEPTLTEWVESGKISRSLPILNKELSKQKIIPKNRMEVADSAASWNRQAIDKRVISMPSQLPLWKRIKYNFADFPLLKKRGDGGNLFEEAGQMQIGRPFWQSQTQQPSFMESLAEFNRQQEIKKQQQRQALREKINTVGKRLAEERMRETSMESNDNAWIETPLLTRKKNPHLSRRAEEGAKAHAAWEKEHPVLNTIGTALGAAPFAIAATPLLAAAGEAVAPVLANPYVDAALTSGFGAHGLNHAINEGIDGWGDAAMTALEVAPLGRLAKPAAEWAEVKKLSPNSLGANGSPLESRTITPQITAENAASITPKVNWDADNWFKTISGRNSYSAEEAAELASHVPEYRTIEQKLFDEGKLALDSNGNTVVVGSEMSPQEYIMRQSEAFQKMNPEHHYVGVSKDLRNSFENESRDPTTKNRYEVWADRKSSKNVEEYAQSQQGGYTNDSNIERLQHEMAIREENYELHQEQLKWKYEHGKISQETYNQDLKTLKNNYAEKQEEAQKELDVLVQQKQKNPLNGGKVFDVTYPKEVVETPIIDAENSHWASIPFNNVVRDAPNVVSHYRQRPYSNTLQTDQIISAARRNGYDVTHIDNVMDTYNGTMLNETIIGRDTPVKSVLGNTGTFDIESPNKWRLYRSLLPPFIGLGATGTLYGKQEYAHGGLMGNYYDGWGDLVNTIKRGVQTARQKVKDWGLDKGPVTHLAEAVGLDGTYQKNTNHSNTNNLGWRMTTALEAGRAFGVNNWVRGKNDDTHYRQNLYNLIDPTDAVPRSKEDVAKQVRKVIKAKSDNDYAYRRDYVNPTADAAWAKRLGLPYDSTLLINNPDGSVHLSRELEEEIPTDTTFIKDRIAANEKRLNNTYGAQRQTVGDALDFDRKTLEALRHTYRTGEPVELNEHSHVSRNWQGLKPEEVGPTPLSVLHRYTGQYDKNNNTFNYWDTYNFDEFEDFVPGKPFSIRGSINLNKK